MIALFEREFIESQEASRLRVIAQFRALERADHFVWLRGFADMDSRRRALEGFYGGPVWANHRNAANATMVDSDNVRLLRPAKTSWALTTPATPRARSDAQGDAGSATVFVLTLCALQVAPYAAFKRWFEPRRCRCAGAVRADRNLRNRASSTTTRACPCTDEQVFAWLARVPTAVAGAGAASGRYGRKASRCYHG